jgi:gamma-glutamylcyclotransferase (GGCT)/AIG2-like uncharacterized protein YtfP
MTPGNERVEGFLLTFAESGVLAFIDQLEGYNSQRPPKQNEYNRRVIQVYNISDEPLGEAWGYLMSRERVQQLGGVLLPSGWWSGE